MKFEIEVTPAARVWFKRSAVCALDTLMFVALFVGVPLAIYLKFY